MQPEEPEEASNLNSTPALESTGENAVHKGPLRRFADVLVYILHPAFLFFYFFLFIINIYTGYRHLYVVVPLVFLFTVLIPALLPILYARDAFLKKREVRTLPLVGTIVCYAAAFIIIRQAWFTKVPQNIPLLDALGAAVGLMFSSLLLRMLLSLIIGLAISCIITRWYKISLHGNGIGFLLWQVVYYFGYNYLQGSFQPSFEETGLALILLILSAIVLWQRVVSQSHTVGQVVLGFIMGFVGTGLIEWYWPVEWL